MGQGDIGARVVVYHGFADTVADNTEHTLVSGKHILKWAILSHAELRDGAGGVIKVPNVSNLKVDRDNYKPLYISFAKAIVVKKITDTAYAYIGYD